ncbi:LuxR family transcriptional regulator [Mycobacterium sp. PS03-16]|nr:LuxR family transcriptional regulator [Mycobacterium sp. PS03-16]
MDQISTAVAAIGETAVNPQQMDQQLLLDTAIGNARYVLLRLPLDGGDRLNGLNLSPRELEIARMVAKGLTNKSIARVLDISLWTVSTHLRRVFTKLGVGTRAAMVARLLEEDSIVGDALHHSERAIWTTRGRSVE